MRRIRTFIDYLIAQEEVSFRPEHKRNGYNSIYGKIIYPVAFNPLDERGNSVYVFDNKKCYYEMIR